MTAEEERAILKALDPASRRGKTDPRPMVRFLTDPGLRLEEGCNLRGPDVDWTASVLTLPKTKAGKTQHVPLNAEALSILRVLTARDGGGYYFAWPGGRPWTPSYVTRFFAKAVKRAGISDQHVHDTRDTFACRLLRAGVDIYTVSKLLRHASVVMSEPYAHLSQNDLKVAVERKSMLQTGTE